MDRLDNYILGIILSFLTGKELKIVALVCERFCKEARKQPLYLKCSIENVLLFRKYAYVYSYMPISKSLTDVSSLGTVHTLDLSYCYNLTDVSSLGTVHTLDLSFFSWDCSYS